MTNRKGVACFDQEFYGRYLNSDRNKYLPLAFENMVWYYYTSWHPEKKKREVYVTLKK